METVYLFAVCLVLALLEIQIEGAHGWAAKLPTWRIDGPVIRKLFGRPITGYFVYLNSLLLLLLHAPFLWMRWSWRLEAAVLSTFFFMAVFWDFLWFAANPHFTLRQFGPKHVWWYRHWVLGLPVDYYVGLAISFAIHATAWPVVRWCVAFLILTGLTVLATLLFAARKRGPAVSME